MQQVFVYLTELVTEASHKVEQLKELVNHWFDEQTICCYFTELVTEVIQKVAQPNKVVQYLIWLAKPSAKWWTNTWFVEQIQALSEQAPDPYVS